MKLTEEQVQETLVSAWGKMVYVGPLQMIDGGVAYIATDRGDHWMLLRYETYPGTQLFEAPNSLWPDPRSRIWEDSIHDVSIPLVKTFLEQENKAAIRRLHYGITLALARGLPKAGEEKGPWVFTSAQIPEVRWNVGDKCDCPDAEYSWILGGWCSHRIARELCERAVQLLRDKGPYRKRYEGRAPFGDG
jgi:hypothetical protein